MARSNLSGRVKVEKLTGGLDTLVDPLMGDLSKSPDCANVRVETGLLRQRKGYRILGREPSRLSAPATAKTRGYLTFTAASSTYANAGVTNAWTLGTKWTVLFEVNFAIAANQSATTKTLMFVLDANSVRPIEIQAIGDGTNIKIAAVIKDLAAATTVTLTGSTNQTAAVWANSLDSRYIRVTRDGATLNLYVGETLEATSSAFSLIQHGVYNSLNLFRNTTGPVYADGVFYGLTIVNRVLAEEEAYWGINYPVDPEFEDTQILGNWPAIQGAGTTLTDYSKYGNNMSITTAAWTTGTNRAARGLGLFTYRRRDGSKWHVVGATRTATEDSGPTAPSGAIYIWQADQDFYPFYFGGLKSANDTTASLDGLSLFHRICFLNYRDILYAINGSDFGRQYYTSWGYLGGTAPAAAPVVSSGAGANAWTYCYTFYNTTTKKETGRSPTTQTTTGTTGITIQTFASSDSQFTKARIYRTANGGTVFYLIGEIAVGAAYTELVGMTDANAQKQPLLAGPDGSAAGNFLVKRSFVPGGPATAPSAASGGAGNVDAGLHYWFYTWYNSTTGDESGFSPAGSRTVGVGGETVNITGLTLPPSGTQYDQMRMYRTKAGAYTITRIGAFSASVTFGDNTADAGITETIETMALPPKCAYAVPFASRVFYGGDSRTEYRGTFWWSAAGQGEDVTWTAGHDPNPGAELTGIHATQFNIFFHYSDGRIFVMDHPGPDAALEQFVPFNCREYSAVGATIGHYTIQKTPLGTIWLGADGFYRATAEGPENISPTISPSFLNLNRQRGRYACSLYDQDQVIYRCWVSRGNKRLSDECFVLDLRNLMWVVDDDPSADCAAVMLDGKEGRHYCALRENGVLVEMREADTQDGDSTGTNSGTPGSPSMVTATEWATRVGPVGYDGGFPIWFIKSDGTIAKRTVLTVAGAGVDP